MTRLVDTEAAAAALGSTTRHVQKLIQAGKLTNKGTNRRIMVDPWEILDKLDAGEIRKGRTEERGKE